MGTPGRVISIHAYMLSLPIRIEKYYIPRVTWSKISVIVKRKSIYYYVRTRLQSDEGQRYIFLPAIWHDFALRYTREGMKMHFSIHRKFNSKFPCNQICLQKNLRRKNITRYVDRRVSIEYALLKSNKRLTLTAEKCANFKVTIRVDIFSNLQLPAPLDACLPARPNKMGRSSGLPGPCVIHCVKHVSASRNWTTPIHFWWTDWLYLRRVQGEKNLNISSPSLEYSKTVKREKKKKIAERPQKS